MAMRWFAFPTLPFGGDYDLVRTGEDRWRLSLAVPGFAPGDLDLIQTGNRLTVQGRRVDDRAQQAFARSLPLAPHVTVAGSELRHGVLHIELARELPAALKPRRIPIGGGRTLPARTLSGRTEETFLDRWARAAGDWLRSLGRRGTALASPR
jgi:molecular chaperone IbpA